MRANDLLGGAGLALFGTAGLVLSSELAFGTMRGMGPGFLPTVLSWVVIVIGLATAADGIRSVEPRAAAPTTLRPLALVAAALAFFALTIKSLGLLTAVAGTAIIGAGASPESRRVEVALLAVGLAAGTWLLFVAALGLPLKVLPP